MDAALTKSERETLKAIWRLTSNPRADGGGARTGDLAASLRLSPATMTATVKKLADRGLAVHTPYHGVELTEVGRRRAMSVVRRHRIVERFLADMLGYSWAEADRLAPTFEHQLPQEVEERLFVALDRPATCPHGFPIPGVESADLPGMPPLYDLSPGDRAVIALPGSTDPDVAMFLDGLGVRPGRRGRSPREAPVRRSDRRLCRRPRPHHRREGGPPDPGSPRRRHAGPDQYTIWQQQKEEKGTL